jgi:ring-1,2-phenylacetyl-CoA epoxidase subunit PaaC
MSAEVSSPIPNSQFLFSYTLHLADTALILGHRNSEWCGHGPVLEQDIAITNLSLDLIGQSRSFYQYAAKVEGAGRTEDDLAYLRSERDFKNLLLAEQPNGDWAQTILRQFFISAFQHYYYDTLSNSKDASLAAIAAKALKEVTYHLRWSSEWVIRLGDGTEESHARMRAALNELWMYTGELFMPAPYETAALAAGIAPDIIAIQPLWQSKVQQVLEEATLELPAAGWMQSGGKTGTHTEHLGFILADLQYMQRTYPGCEW